MNGQLKELKKQIDEAIAGTSSTKELYAVKLDVQAKLKTVMSGMRDLPKEERPVFGKIVNEFKQALEQQIASAEQVLKQKELEQKYAAETVMVWSTAIAADGTFTSADGEIWGCVGDIPVNKVEVTVSPSQIAFKSIVRDGATGGWELALTNLVRGCWYKLYATNSLVGGFAVGEGVCEPVTNFQAEADGEFIFKVEDAGEAMFWKAVAEPGILKK